MTEQEALTELRKSGWTVSPSPVFVWFAHNGIRSAHAPSVAALYNKVTRLTRP